MNFGSTGSNLPGLSLGATGSVTYSGTLTPAATSYLLGGGGGTLTFATKIADFPSTPASVIVSGAGSVIPSSTNTYSGGTTINGTSVDNAILSISSDTASNGPGSAAQLGQVPAIPATNISINGGTLQANGTFTLNGNRGIALGSPTGNGAGTLDITVGNTLTYGGLIANGVAPGTGDDALNVTDSGSLVLTGINTYSGGTTIEGGATLAANPSASTSSALGTGTITLAGGRLSLVNSMVQSNALAVVAPSIVDVTGPASGSIPSAVSITGATLQVTGGSTALNAPYSLSLGSGAGGSVSVGNGATFEVMNNGTGTASLTLGPLNGNGAVQTITFAGAGPTTLAGAATGIAAGTQVVIGPGSSSNVSGLVPLSEWNFEEGSGTIAFDTGSARNNGVLTGSVPNGSTAALYPPGYSHVAAIGNSSLSLSGLNTQVVMPYISAYASLSSYTVSAWINIPLVPANGGIYDILSTRGQGNLGAVNDLADLGITAGSISGKTTVVVNIGNGSKWLVQNANLGNVSITPGSWYLVTCTVAPNGGTIYFDGGTVAGGSQASFNFSGTPLLANASSEVTLGNVAPNSNEPFVGNIDDIRIYNEALTAAQIAQLYATSGGTVVNANNPTALGTTAQLMLTNGSTLNLGASQTVSGLAGNGSVALNGNTLTVGSIDNANSAFPSIISDGTVSGAVVKGGAGGVALLNSNTYTGGTTADAGVLVIGVSNAPLGAGSLNLNGGRLALIGQQSNASLSQGLKLQLYLEGGQFVDSSLANMTSLFSRFSPNVTTQTTTGGLASISMPATALESQFQSQGVPGGIGLITAQLSGQIMIAQPGMYSFGTGGYQSAVFVDSGSAPVALANQSIFQSTAIYLAAGMHTLEIGYESTGTAFHVNYSGPDTNGAVVPIPNSVLLSGAGTATSTQAYSNNVAATGNSAIDLSGTLTAKLGDLAIGSSTLNVTSGDNSGGAYSLTFAGSSNATSLTGNPTFNITGSVGWARVAFPLAR